MYRVDPPCPVDLRHETLTRLDVLDARAADIPCSDNGAHDAILAERRDAILRLAEQSPADRPLAVALAWGNGLTEHEVRSWLDLAEEKGAAPPRIGPAIIADLLSVEKVPNYLLRARLDDLEGQGVVTSSRVAFLIGETKRHADGMVVGDATRVDRMLGRELSPSGKRADGTRLQGLRLFLDYSQAVSLAKALGLDPHSIGI